MANALSLLLCMVCVAACHGAVEEHRKLLQEESVLLGSPALSDAAAEPPAPDTLMGPSLGTESSGARRLLQEESVLLASPGLSDAAAEPPAPDTLMGPSLGAESSGARRLLQEESVLLGSPGLSDAAAEPPAPEMGSTMPGAGGDSTEGGLRKL